MLYFHLSLQPGKVVFNSAVYRQKGKAFKQEQPNLPPPSGHSPHL
jgi:hypothetical protein